MLRSLVGSEMCIRDRCTEITNASPQTQTVQVEFALANFGIGLPFAPIDAPGNPRLVEVPPGATVQVCIQWIPVTPGHQCIQVTVYDEAGTFPALRSQRNLDVSEVLVPGQPATFELPVGNQTGGPVDVQMVVRNNCPGWTVDVQPPTFFLPIGGTEVVGVVVTPAAGSALGLSLIHISEPTRLLSISYAVFCLKKKISFS